MSNSRTPITTIEPRDEPLLITRLGAEGDGVGRLEDGRACYAARTLPGERVLIQPGPKRGDGIAGAVLEILEPSAHRVEPCCRHFGSCGGCALQHADPIIYAEFKRGLLVSALQRAGFATREVAPVQRTEPGTRRRMDFGLRRVDGKIRLGLHATGGTALIDLLECPVLHPTLEALIAPLRAVAARLEALRREGSAVVNLLSNGPDLLLRTDGALARGDRLLLNEFATTHGISRIAWARDATDPEPVCVLRPPLMRFACMQVSPPPGAFLQASEAGEAAILAAILAGLPAKFTARARIIELYAGCGSFTGALAERARVLAVEGDAAAVESLRQAAQGKRIEVVRRDLTRQMLLARELAGAPCIVLDPPFAGAGPQMPEIAASGVARIIYVSCNPVALGRDAALLQAAGYRLLAATPIDQFLYSARLEAVVVFAKPARQN